MSTATVSLIGGVVYGAIPGFKLVDVQGSAPAAGSPVGTQIAQFVRLDNSFVAGKVVSITPDAQDHTHITFNILLPDLSKGTVDVWMTDAVKHTGDVAINVPGIAVARTQVLPVAYNGVFYGPSVNVLE